MPLRCCQHGLLFFTLPCSRIAESFGERVVIDFQLRDLFILISRDGDEFRLLEDVGAKRAVGQLEDVVGSHQMKSRLVLVHRIQYREAVLVRDVVGQFQFVEGNDFLHPLLARCWTVGMNVHSLGHFGIGFAGHHPTTVVEFVSVVVCGHNVQQQNVLGFRIESRHAEFHLRKHLPARFGDDHFGAQSVKLFPQIFRFEADFGIVGNTVVFHRRQSAQRSKMLGGGSSGCSRRGEHVFGRRVRMWETDRGRMGG